MPTSRFADMFFSTGSSPELRVGDVERANAMEALGHALSQGLIDLAEYDERCRRITQVTTRTQLAEVFADLPQDYQRLSSQATAVSRLYSSEEIALAHARSKHPRLATALIGSLGAAGLSIGLAQPAVLLLIPAIFVLLYVAKVGPASWHAPSEAQLQRAQVRQIRAESRLQLEQSKAQRRQIQEDLKTQAFHVTQGLFKRP